MTLEQISKYNFWLVIITGFWGSAFLSKSLGGYHIFPFRIFFLFAWYIFVINLCLKNRLNLTQMKPYKFPVLFFLFCFFYAFCSILWVASLELWLRNVAFLFIGITLMFGCMYHFKTFRDLKIFIIMWMVILCCLNFIGLWEVTTGNHLLTSNLLNRQNKVFIPTSVFHNQNDYATFLTLSICFLLPLTKNIKKVFHRICGGILLVSSLYLLAFTTSRSNIIATVMVFISWYFSFLKEYTLRGKFFLLILLIPLMITFFSFFIQTSIIQSLTFQITERIGSGGVRINLIQNSFSFLANSLGLGVGAGNAEWYMQNKAIFDTKGIVNVHNWWVELLTNYGIIIFFLYCCLYMYVTKKSFKISKKTRSPWNKIFAESVFLGCVGFFLASCSSSSIIAFKPQWFFWGFSFSYLGILKQSPETKV
jgi:teichuronic acid biosynthesis protein TuaE